MVVAILAYPLPLIRKDLTSMNIYSIKPEDLYIFESLKDVEMPQEHLINSTYSKEFNPFYGKHHTEETKELLSYYASLRVGPLNNNYGKYWTEEQKQVISKLHKGKSLTDEHKQKLSLAFTGENNHQYGKVGKLSPNFGKIRTEETKQKISAALKGQIIPQEVREKMSAAKQNMSGENHPNFGKKYNMKSSTCPHCGKTGSQNMKRYHFENCKLKV